MEFRKYPHIDNLETLKAYEIKNFLNRTTYWEIKEDGSNLGFWIDDKGKNRISSRKLENASIDLVNSAKSSEEYEKIFSLLKENPFLIVYAELCRKGRSITGIKTYDRTKLIVFDIFNTKENRFLKYEEILELTKKYQIPIVKLFSKNNHKTIKDILKYKNYVLGHCKVIEEEGMVAKTFVNNKMFLTKVKVDIPERTKKKISKKIPILPQIPDSEIFGCIDKAWQELGNEKFRDKKLAMPLIAKYVKESCKEHLYSNIKNLFPYYLQYCERMMNKKE